MRGRLLLLLPLLAGAPGCREADLGDLGRGGSRQPLTQSPLSSAYPWAVRLGPANLGGCSASVLSDHWVLLAGHCFGTSPSGPFSSEILYTPSAGVLETVWSGSATPLRPFLNTADPSGDNDIGLVYLQGGLGFSGLAATGQANLYLDTRDPWCSSISMDPSDRIYTVAAYGTGSDEGGSSDCSVGTSGPNKRVNQSDFSGYPWNQCAWNTVYSNVGGAHVCPGDSGAPMFFQRDGIDVAFAVVVFGGVANATQGGTLIRNHLAWMETETWLLDRTHALSLSTETSPSGYAYGVFSEVDREIHPSLTVASVSLLR